GKDERVGHEGRPSEVVPAVPRVQVFRVEQTARSFLKDDPVRGTWLVEDPTDCLPDEEGVENADRNQNCKPAESSPSPGVDSETAGLDHAPADLRGASSSEEHVEVQRGEPHAVDLEASRREHGLHLMWPIFVVEGLVARAGAREKPKLPDE